MVAKAVAAVPTCTERPLGRTEAARAAAIAGPSSYAPMSQIAVPLLSPSTGRTKPRWSSGGQPVGPPLSGRGLRRGSVELRSPGPLKPQVVPLSRLWPAAVRELPPQFPGLLL